MVFELGSDLPGNVQAMATVIPDIPTEKSKATLAGKKLPVKRLNEDPVYLKTTINACEWAMKIHMFGRDCSVPS